MRLGLRHKLLVGFELATLAAGAAVLAVFPHAWLPVCVLTAACVVIGWVACLITAAKIQGALGRVRRVADAIGRGDFSQRNDPNPHDEVAKLARSLDRMAARLEEIVDEHHRLEEKLTRSEKLALIGELAATVAHEVNNPLDGLQNCIRIVRRNPTDEQQLRRLLDLMDGGLYRIEMIVKRLLSLSKHQVAQLAPTPVDEVVREARTFVDAKVAKHHVEIVTELPPERVYALADRQQLEQALINLMLNALDSMPDGGQLVLRVSTPDPHRGTLTISVCDSGAGMTPEQREHIFEPFFSTKTSHGGTGLGLAVVSRIVEAHQGRIEVESAPGQGSTFTLELPSATPQPLATVPEPVPMPVGMPPREMPDAG